MHILSANPRRGERVSVSKKTQDPTDSAHYPISVTKTVVTARGRVMVSRREFKHKLKNFASGLGIQASRPRPCGPSGLVEFDCRDRQRGNHNKLPLEKRTEMILRHFDENGMLVIVPLPQEAAAMSTPHVPIVANAV